jgi:hypothetical protein
LPRNGRIFFPAKGNIAFKPGGWSGAVSFWLNTDPNKLLKTRFCDPVQITHKGANNGGLWFDFNDAKPRDARMGAFPAFASGEQGIKEDDPAAPLVIIKGVEFKEGEWHHVVLNWRNFDTGRADAAAELFIDGKSIGRIENRAIAMSWDLDKAGIYVAVNYLGLLDELAVFSRSLSEAETASPSSRVVRGPPRSGVRRSGSDSTAATARRMRSAAERVESRPSHSSIMAVLRIIAVGLAMPRPAMSGALP